MEITPEPGMWMASYCNDYSGYIPSLRVLLEGGCEAEEGWADDVEDRIATGVRRAMKTLPV